MKYLILSILIITGCTSAPELRIASSIPARIEADGITICEQTPCTIDGASVNGEFGGCLRGGTTLLEAFPIDKSEGYTQSKRVVGSCGKKDLVFFDMQSRGGVTAEKGKSTED